MQKKLAELIEDFTLYPRADVDDTHVRNLKLAILAGEQLPPIIVDSRTLRIADGFHRRRAYIAVYGEAHEIEIEARKFASDRELFEFAMAANARHGRMLSQHDRAAAALRAKALKIADTKIAAALGITQDALAKLLEHKTALVSVRSRDGKATEIRPIKRTIAHMAGHVLSQEQAAQIPSMSGQAPLRSVNELLSLMRHDMIDTANLPLLAALRVLADEIHAAPWYASGPAKQSA